VFGPPGSGPSSFSTIWIRILQSTSKKSKTKEFLDFYYFYEIDVNVPSKSNKQKNLFFVGILSPTDEKQEPDSDPDKSIVRICGSGSVPKRHGSTTKALYKWRTASVVDPALDGG